MSNYKTPIRIHINSTRKVNDKIAKYRLPFKKDEPLDDKEYQMSYLQNDSCIIQSRIKPKNEKDVESEREKIKKKEEEEKKSEENKKQKQVKGNQSSENIKETLGNEESSRFPQKMQESTSYHNAEDQDTNQARVPSKNNLKIISAIKPRIFQEEPEPKKDRYNSVISQYEEEINFADRSLQSDADINYGLQKNKEPSSKAEKKEEQGKFPQIKSRVLHSSLNKQKPESKAWRILSQEIQECRHQSLKKEPKRRKKRSSQFKINKFNFKSYEEDNECLNIQAQLKKLNRDNPDIQLQNKQDFYIDLPPIPEDGQSYHQNKKQSNFIQKLRQAIQFQQQSRKNKLKFPLQYYVENYYKIREINPFFRKLNQLGGCIMLSIGKLKVFQSGHQIYSEGQPITHVYLIIVGKVFLTNSHKSFKKFALTGQTLGEQSLFQEGKPYGVRLARGSRPMFHREEAKSISKVIVLRIKLQKYFKMSNQLCSIGYRNMFNLVDNLFRINYYKKQSLYHGQPKGRVLTEGMLNKRYKVSSQFFY